jgi:hypothetical protein
MSVPLIAAEPLRDADGVRHGFFTRLGGVSEGRYSSLNCGLGSGDAPDRVRENRSRVGARLGCADADRLVTTRQVHSARVVVVDDAWPADARPEADGLVSRRRNLVLGILTADCAPVLFADPDAGVIGAAHAGWRGARAGVLEATVVAMRSLGAVPGRIVAAVGPCIGFASYEVGPEFHQGLVAEEPACTDLFAPSARVGHFLFDLAGYVGHRLDRIGLRAHAAVGRDTCAEPEQFFSFRRATIAGAGDYGRQISAIVLDG